MAKDLEVKEITQQQENEEAGEIEFFVEDDKNETVWILRRLL